MRVYVVRHGKAEKSSGMDDAARRLVERGEMQALWMGRKLSGSDAPPRVVVSSPVTRAWQTARLVVYTLECELRRDPRLTTGVESASVVEVLEELSEAEGRDSVAIVGHNPTLSDVVAELVGRGAHPGRTAGPDGEAFDELRTGQAAVLDYDPRGKSATLLGLWRESDEA